MWAGQPEQWLRRAARLCGWLLPLPGSSQDRPSAILFLSVGKIGTRMNRARPVGYGENSVR